MDTHSIVNLGIGLLLPVLVALGTRAGSSPRVKSAMLLLVAVLTSVLSALTDWSWSGFVKSFAQQFAAAVTAHFGFLSPVGLTGSAGVIQQALPGGVGTDQVPAAEAGPPAEGSA